MDAKGRKRHYSPFIYFICKPLSDLSFMLLSRPNHEGNPLLTMSFKFTKPIKHLKISVLCHGSLASIDCCVCTPA